MPLVLGPAWLLPLVVPLPTPGYPPPRAPPAGIIVYADYGCRGAGWRREMLHQALNVKMEILSELVIPDTVSRCQEWPVLDTATTFQKSEKHSVFNSKKYISYYSYLETKGFISLNNGNNVNNGQNQEFHGNRNIANSRSRAGSIC